MDRLKAKIIAKGYNQERIDFFVTSSVVKLATVRIILSIVAVRHCSYQMDVKNSFLNGSLNETVLLSQPSDFKPAQSSTQVC